MQCRRGAWAPVPNAGIIDRELRQSGDSGNRRWEVRHSAWEYGFLAAFRLVRGVAHTREVVGSNPAAPMPKPLKAKSERSPSNRPEAS